MTPQTDKTQATNEELLRKVIEAQVKGGCERWIGVLNGVIVAIADGKKYPMNMLPIVLDTEGAKASWGDNKIGLNLTTTPTTNILRFHSISEKVLKAWHSGEGNNVRAALETAVSFLPEA